MVSWNHIFWGHLLLELSCHKNEGVHKLFSTAALRQRRFRRNKCHFKLYVGVCTEFSTKWKSEFRFRIPRIDQISKLVFSISRIFFLNVQARITRQSSCVTTTGVPSSVYPAGGGGVPLSCLEEAGVPLSCLGEVPCPVQEGRGFPLSRGTPLQERTWDQRLWSNPRPGGTPPPPPPPANTKQTNTCVNIIFPVHPSDAAGKNCWEPPPPPPPPSEPILAFNVKTLWGWEFFTVNCM